MNVEDEYKPSTKEDGKKLVISNGAFAVVTMLEKLIQTINKQTAAMRR